ncbi:MAG TPA: hypothetical protein VHQ70_10850, partial [Syntrophomonadaceae bacterium]|nr:hypothetical protein [Syntrophomonadaceae bacterium]
IKPSVSANKNWLHLEPNQEPIKELEGSAADISFMGDDFYYEPNIMSGVSTAGMRSIFTNAVQPGALYAHGICNRVS